MKKINGETTRLIYDDYKKIRNKVTKLKEIVDYYQRFFDDNIKKSSVIWKGIRSIVNINNTCRKDVKLLNDKGKNVCNLTKIAEILNKYVVCWP